MKKIFIVLLTMVSISYSFAQPDDYRADLDNLFGNLSRTRPGTGYLAPYGLDATIKTDFNGILTDSNVVNSLDLFRLVYTDMVSAKFNPSAPDLPSLTTLNTDISAAPTSSLVLLYAYYNEFNPEAVNQGFINYTNSSLYDNNMAAGAYTSNHLFVCGPVQQVFTNTVTFSYNPTLFYQNCNVSIQDIWIDFGDGYASMAAHADYSHTFRPGGVFTINYT